MGGAGSRKAVTRRAPRRPTRPANLHDAAVAFDAEDIALARLQVQLRKSEAIQTPARSASSAPRRVTLRLAEPLLERLRARARREGTTLSDLAGKAVEQFLRSA